MLRKRLDSERITIFELNAEQSEAVQTEPMNNDFPRARHYQRSWFEGTNEVNPMTTESYVGYADYASRRNQNANVRKI